MAAPRKDNIKEKILQATTELLKTTALADISLAEIAAAAGISKGTLYYHYKTKNEVFLETLVRYGNRYQADQAAAANSLFGGDNVVDIATPEIPEAERWSDLDRLNKERDLVGIIYLPIRWMNIP